MSDAEDQPSPTPINRLRIIAEVEAEAERRHQQSKGYGAEHDDQHVSGELAFAGAYFAAIGPASLRSVSENDAALLRDVQKLWPTGWLPPTQRTHRENLIVAAAFLFAEIERFDRQGVLHG